MADLPSPGMWLALVRFQYERGVGSLALRPVLISACEEAGVLTWRARDGLVLGDITVELGATHDHGVCEWDVGATNRRHRRSILAGAGKLLLHTGLAVHVHRVQQRTRRRMACDNGKHC
jgi:hypothetical protein